MKTKLTLALVAFMTSTAFAAFQAPLPEFKNEKQLTEWRAEKAAEATSQGYATEVLLMNRFHFILIAAISLTFSFELNAEIEITSMPIFSVERSEEVYFGKFSSRDVLFVVIVPSEQKTIHPIPKFDINKKMSVAANLDFLNRFAEQFKPATSKPKEIPVGFIRSFHLFVVFSKGDSACLHGSLFGEKFLIQPMFKENGAPENLVGDPDVRK